MLIFISNSGSIKVDYYNINQSVFLHYFGNFFSKEGTLFKLKLQGFTESAFQKTELAGQISHFANKIFQEIFTCKTPSPPCILLRN